MNKKAAIQELQALIVPLIGISIVLVIGFLIFAEVKDQVVSSQGGDFCPSDGTTSYVYNATAPSQCYNSTGTETKTAAYTHAFNATGEIQNATQDIPGWLPIIIITVIGAILLGLVAYFRRR